MKHLKCFVRNLPFGLSAAAYMILAVPATGTGLAVGMVLTAVCLALGSFTRNIWKFTKENGTAGYWITAAAVCLLMGLRFDNVWKLSGQVGALASRLELDPIVLLTTVGCILAVCAVYFVVAVLIWLTIYPLGLLRDGNSPAEARRPSRLLCIGLIILLAVQLVVLCSWGIQKQGFHVDEVYTFELSNYPDTIYGDGEDAYTAWKTGDAFAAVLEPADGRLFDLSVPFWNGETDNHPSTYYMLVNIVSSLFKFFGMSANKWAGLIPNFACCLVTTIFFVLLLRKLLKNDIVALCGGAAWAFCIGAINTGVYLRMYALLTMAAMIFCWLHAKLLSDYVAGHSVRRTLVLVQLATIFGILSQYYFLFFAFFFCGFVSIYFFVKKDWNMLGCYIATEISSVAAAELLFPRMMVRLLFGDRGSEALENMLHGSGYGSQLRSVLEIINQELFGGYGTAVLVISTVLLAAGAVVCRHKKERFSVSDGVALLALATACGYILAVTKIAPYQVDRYFMCVFPLLILYTFYGICRGVFALTKKNRRCAAIAAIVLVVLTFVCTASGEISYIYPDGTERAEKLKAYENLPVVALNGDYYNDSVLQWAFEFQDFDHVFLCRNNTVSDIAIAAEDHMLDNGFLLYVHQDTTDEEALFEEIGRWIEIEEYLNITDAQGCRVYYCAGLQK